MEYLEWSYRMYHRILFAIFAFLAFVYLSSQGVVGQEQHLEGPIVLAQSADYVDSEATITFQDIGTGYVWQYETNFRIHNEHAWSPDGCHVVLKDSGGQYFLLSITDLKLEPLPEYGIPAWSTKGGYSSFINYNSGQYTVYLMDLSSLKIDPVLASESWIGNLVWFSEDEFYYETLHGRFVWSRHTTTGTELAAVNEHFRLMNARFRTQLLSPDLGKVFQYNNVLEYRGAFDPFVEDLTEDEIVDLEADRPNVTGFSIHFLQENVSKYNDVNDQFILFAEWSPSSTRIAIITDYMGDDFGIYVYDIQQDSLQRLADAYWEVSQAYYPSWSSDSQWLAYRTESKYVIYNLIDGTHFEPASQLDGPQVFWSPIMDYGASQCGSE